LNACAKTPATDSGHCLTARKSATFSCPRFDFSDLPWDPAFRNFILTTNGFRGLTLGFMIPSPSGLPARRSLVSVFQTRSDRGRDALPIRSSCWACTAGTQREYSWGACVCDAYTSPFCSRFDHQYQPASLTRRGRTTSRSGSLRQRCSSISSHRSAR